MDNAECSRSRIRIASRVARMQEAEEEQLHHQQPFRFIEYIPGTSRGDQRTSRTQETQPHQWQPFQFIDNTLRPQPSPLWSSSWSRSGPSVQHAARTQPHQQQFIENIPPPVRGQVGSSDQQNRQHFIENALPPMIPSWGGQPVCPPLQYVSPSSFSCVKKRQSQLKVDVIHNQLTSPDVTHCDSYPNIEGIASTNIFMNIRGRN